MDRIEGYIRVGVSLLVAFAVLIWVSICFRWSALIFAAVLGLAALLSRPARRRFILALAGGGVDARMILGAAVFLAVFLGLSLAPIDISFRGTPGPPRIIKYIHGLPSERAREMARRGDAVLGGCVVSGCEPDWLIVW